MPRSLFLATALEDMTFFGLSRDRVMPAFKVRLGCACLLLVLLLTGCGESPPDNEGEQAPPVALLESTISEPSPAPSAQPETPETPATADHALQLGAFRNRKNADHLFDRLEKLGLHPYMISTVEERPWFKVRLGPFASPEEARERARALKGGHGLQAVVVRQEKEGLLSSAADAPAWGGTSAAATPGAAPAAGGGGNIDAVVSRFTLWIDAWQELDIDTYLSFYARDFTRPGQTREEWLKSRRKALSRVRRVKVEVGEVRIREVDDTVEMSFVQNFWSNLRADISQKTLVWKMEDGEWKIIRETAQPA
jgi:hypothetical protein